MKMILSLAGRFFYMLMGWRFEQLPPYFSKKHVIIGFPHTSNMDTVRAFIGFRIVKLKGHIMIKKEWFQGPMKTFLTGLGGIPVDRNAAKGVVGQMVDQFRNRDAFLLAIVPEGTRKGTQTIKTGFWHIAKAADVSIICWYLDNKHKITRWLGEVVPTEDMAADLLHIRDIYTQAGYTFPLDINAIKAEEKKVHESNRR